MKLVSAEFLERELKFRAKSGSLETFMALGGALEGHFVLGAGADVYWTNPAQPKLPPVRHRYSQGYGELTIKKQVTAGSNVSRHEVNVRLDDAQLREIETMLPMMGYLPALKISKVSHIYYTEYVVLSWYSVMGMDGKLLYMDDGSPAQFVEIELREDLDWRHMSGEDFYKALPKSHQVQFQYGICGCEDCHYVLAAWGDALAKLNIVSQPPIKESLWEMFGNTTK